MPVDAPAAPPTESLAAVAPKPAAAPKPSVRSAKADFKAPSPDAIRNSLQKVADRGPNEKFVTKENLDKIGATPEDVKPTPPEAPKTEVKTPEQVVAEVEQGEKPTETPKVEGDKKIDAKKTGPWQLKEAAEKKAREYEKRALDAESKLAQMADMDKIRERADKAESRLKELEDEIRFVDYSKSEEFKTKYQQPYEQAWTQAVSDLKELSVTLPDGNERSGTVQDLLAIANLPLGEARKRAKEMFGEGADDVMAHYRKVRELSGAQQKALEDARKNGAEVQKQRTEKMSSMASENGRIFQSFVQEDASKHDFLKPKEGDEEWNSTLQKAQSFVDEAFATNASDPRLTPEQRREIIRKHASIRGRAIGYESMKMENKRLKADLAKRDKELAQYRNGEPDGGGNKPVGQASAPKANTMESVEQSLRKLASKNL